MAERRAGHSTPRSAFRAALAAAASGATALAAVTAAGCYTTGETLRGGSGDFRVQPLVLASAQDAGLEGGEITVYLATMEALVSDDPVLKADTFRAVEIAAQTQQTTTSRLNLALALATPDHPGSDPAAAQRLLAELLASGSDLLPEERILATDHLKHVEQRLILDAEASQLRDQLTAARDARTTQNAEQLRTLAAENERLQDELAEAREKLDAITNIEQSIRERENAANVE